MNDKVISIILPIIIIIIFSLNFWDKWINFNYEVFKDRRETWFWFKPSKIKETKDNFKKFIRALSVIVIAIMIITIILTLY